MTHKVPQYVSDLEIAVAERGIVPSELERHADSARHEGFLNDLQYTILKYRIPFTGSERKTQKQIGINFGVKHQYIQQTESAAYDIFRGYLIWASMGENRKYPPGTTIDKLPFKNFGLKKRILRGISTGVG